MRINIKFFGATAELVGKREAIETVGNGESLGDIVRRFVLDYPSLGTRPLLFAVNEEYAQVDTILHDGDELAVFTPVSGG